MRLRKPIAWDKPLDDATLELCAGCGREIVRARLDGGPRVALDHPELGVEPDLDASSRVVLLDHAGRARPLPAEGRTTNVARHTRHDCSPHHPPEVPDAQR